MRQLSMNYTTICTIPLIACLSVTSLAQGIPDPIFQAVVNNSWGGLVLSDGNIDPFIFGIWQQAGAPLELDVNGLLPPGDTLDMTGIDLLMVSGTFSIIGAGAGVNRFHVPQWSFNEVGAGFNNASPNDLLQPLPPTVTNLFIRFGGDIGYIDLPAALEELVIWDATSVDGSGWNMPASLDEIFINRSSVVAFPDMTSIDLWVTVFNSPATYCPPLSPNLQNLRLDRTPITSWPVAMPPGLEYLSIAGCQLTALPPGIPSTLEFLDIGSNAIPENLVLPSGLLWLEADTMAWSTLPLLPPNIFSVQARACALQALTDIPASLEYLIVRDNPLLDCLPPLPYAMNELDVTGTAVQCLPNVISASVEPPSLQGVLCPWLQPCPNGVPRIRGKSFADQNANGVLDPGEPGIPQATCEISPANYLVGMDPDGNFDVPVPAGTYGLTANPLLYHTVTTVPHMTPNLFWGNIDSLVHHGYSPIGTIYDLQVVGTYHRSPRPGVTNEYELTVHNVGTTDAGPVTIELVIDPGQTWVDATPQPTSLLGNVATWLLPSFPPYTSWQAEVELMTTSPLGTVLQHELTASHGATEQTPADNMVVIEATVVNSYDPNDKQVFPSVLSPAEIANGTPVDYTIRFQNVGTAPALSVVITDTLSTDLDWSTMQFVASSHGCDWFMLNGVLHFVFDPIFLPDSASAPEDSQGFVTFRMEPSDQLTLGQQVTNVANIYFDLNEPVITAPAILEVALPTTVLTREDGSLKVHPNPVHDRLFITWPQEDPDAELMIVDELGRTWSTWTMTRSSFMLDVSHLPAGLYAILITGKDTLAARFVKQ
ncbi:MAG: hypothetical protein KDB88_14115 [Flavobacteriales bacterium]|nr:hypothetical protein [Flavobacteriales bacterium]